MDGGVRSGTLKGGLVHPSNTLAANFGSMMSVAANPNAYTRSDIAFAPAAGTISRSDISFAAADQSVNTVAGDFVALGFLAGQNIRVVSGTTLNLWQGTILSVATHKLVVQVQAVLLANIATGFANVVTEAAGAAMVIIGGFANNVTTTAGNFLTAGFLPGMTVVVSGSASNNVTAKILTVAALTMTLTGTVLTTEAAGAAMTLTASADDAAFFVGVPTGYIAIGLLLNEQGQRTFSPARPGYVPNEEHCSVVSRGRVRIWSWDSSALCTGALAVPVVGCRVVYSKTTGNLAFLTAGTSVPTGYAQLQGVVVNCGLSPNGIPSAEIDLAMPVAT
jgi:hypothetical protein